MPLLAGAEPYSGRGDGTGALLCHGFTGSPQSMRPWAEHLAAAGLTVELPRLPGHGTRWQDMRTTTSDHWFAEVENALLRLHRDCDEVFVMGMSLGGCLALRLAAAHPDKVAGVVLVNPSLVLENPLLPLAPLLKWIVPSTKGLAGDIRKPGIEEVGYDRVPTAAAATLPKLWRATRRGIPAITAPILAYRSDEDHVIGPRSLRMLGSKAVTTLTVHTLRHSFHVATLDHDAATIFDGSLAFVREHSRSGEGTNR
ncbi:carboxylesterase [Lipingzhangella halophila]|uniref:Carboxylesterase n=1 Tax=Lipingzhangella halophila TaxID=1783352 RepID=A0A7W7RG74_9ACTN|nr:alpha/beta fold hydrolase [Lipingzhangella halophila]MBB4930836.1 carboxylesterase [Lipingzhangella halophila]